MEVSLTARLGGPEVGILFLAGVVHARKRLKAAMGGVSLVGLDVEWPVVNWKKCLLSVCK